MPHAKFSPPHIDRVKHALLIAHEFGGFSGEHHKAWCIDQMVRALTGCTSDEPTAEYLRWVEAYQSGADGPETYRWDVGTPP